MVRTISVQGQVNEFAQLCIDNDMSAFQMVIHMNNTRASWFKFNRITEDRVDIIHNRTGGVGWSGKGLTSNGFRMVQERLADAGYGHLIPKTSKEYHPEFVGSEYRMPEEDIDKAIKNFF